MSFLLPVWVRGQTFGIIDNAKCTFGGILQSSTSLPVLRTTPDLLGVRQALSLRSVWSFSQTVCPHWGVLAVGVKAGLDQGTLSGARNFCCTFSHKSGSVRCLCAFRSRRLAHSEGRSFGSILGPSFFPENSRVKLFLRCPYQFWLRRHAQSVRARHLSCKFSPKNCSCETFMLCI